MAKYKYNVVVEVSIETDKLNSGNQKQKQALRSIENEAIESSRRINAELDKNSRVATQRRNDSIADYKRQTEQTRQNGIAEVQYEQTKNQQLATQNRSYHQERFAQQRAAYNAEQEVISKSNQAHIESEKQKWSNIFQQRQQAATLNAQILARDPFQNLGGRGQTLGQAGRSLNENAQVGRLNQQILARDPFQNAKNLNFAQTRAELEKLDQTVAKSSKGFGLWGQAFKGAFIGAIAGIAFSLLISTITKPIELMGSLAKSAIEAGAAFETTRNSLTVFAGSSREADRELADLDTTARNTAGLRLPDAEAGYRQLRALNFEAETSRQLIAGLGKEKLLSGADDTAVQRVIVNLTQLSSGSARASMDIKEIIHAMPTLRKEFALAFGTIDPKKIAKIFATDSDAAIKKLAEQLEKTKGAAGGLEDAWSKLGDEFTIVGRELSTSVIPEITRDVRALSKYLKENGEAWTSTGVRIANLYHVLRETEYGKGFKGLFDIANISDEEAFRIKRTRDLNAISFEDYVKQTTGLTVEQWQNLGDKRDKLIRDGRGDPLDILPSTQVQKRQMQQLRQGYNEWLNTLEDKQLAPERESQAQAEADRQLIKLTEKLDKDRVNQLSKIDAYYSQVANIRESAFQVEIEENKDNARKTFEIQQRNFQKEIAEINQFFDEKIKLTDGTDAEIFKLEIERNNKIRKLQADQKSNQIAFERAQFQKRLQDLISFNDLEKREIEQAYNRATAEIERGIQKSNISSEKGYDYLLTNVKKRENIQSEFIRSQYALRLSDKSLTDQEIVNLEKERDLDLAQLQDESLQKTREIEDARSETIIKHLTQQREVAKNTYEYLSGLASSFQKDFFNTDTFSSTSLQNFKNFVLKEPKRQSLTDEYQKEADIRTRQVQKMNELNNIMKETSDVPQFNAMSEAWDQMNAQLSQSDIILKNLNGDIIAFDDSIPANYKLFAELADQIGTSAGAVDKLNEAILKHRQTLDSADAQYEIDYWEAVKKNTTDADKLLEVNARLEQARNRQTRLDYDQNVEKAEQYRTSLEGINKEIALLLNKDPKKLGALGDIFDKQQANERKDTLEQIVMLELEIASPNINAQYKVRADILQHIIDLRNEEYDAIARVGKAQLDINRQFVYSSARAEASVQEFLASQKGITEILSDARIDTITAAYDGLDLVAKSIAKSFGFAAKAVENLISSLLKLGLNYIFRKYFGSGFGGNNQGGNSGFSFPNVFGGGGGQSGGFSNGIFGGSQGNGIYNFGTGAFPGGGNFGGGGSTNSSILDTVHGFGTNTHELLHQGTLGRLSGAASGGGGILGGIGGLLPFLGLGLGTRLGGGRGLAGILGGAGGILAGGIGTALLAPGIFGVGTAAGSSPLLGAAFGLLTNPFTIAAAGALLLGAFFLNRNMARRRDEKTRNQAMIDALKDLDDLILKVNNDQIDGNSALSQADEIRKNYVDAMGQLKDKKTRNIALRDVSRLDSKIEQLKAAVAGQSARKDRLALSVPTFADGGTVSRFARNNFKNNPLGYQRGIGSGREDNMIGYFPGANQYAKYSNSEYIFDAETTRNIGYENLDLMRHTKGQSFNQMLSKRQFANRADGGSVSGLPQSSGGIASPGDQPKIEVVLNVTLGMETVLEAFAQIINSNNGSPQLLTDLTTQLKRDGDNEFLRQIANYFISKGLLKK